MTKAKLNLDHLNELATLTELRHLDLSTDTARGLFDGVLGSIARSNPHLEHLAVCSISHEEMKVVALHCPNLQFLQKWEIIGELLDCAEAVESVVQKCRQLTH